MRFPHGFIADVGTEFPVTPEKKYSQQQCGQSGDRESGVDQVLSPRGTGPVSLSMSAKRLYNAAMKSRFLLVILIILSFAGGYFAAQLTDDSGGPRDDGPSYAATSYHDIRVNQIDEYVKLIDCGSKEIRELAASLKTMENAYNFVRDQIYFVPSAPPGPAVETLRHRRGSCLGKAVLLASIYRAMGVDHTHIRLIVGVVRTTNGDADHVWLDLEQESKCWQLDPSGLLGTFSFRAFPGKSYSEAYAEREFFCFNDAGFAVISQLNRPVIRSAQARTSGD